MVKKEPGIGQIGNWKSGLIFQDLGTDLESDDCREMTKKLEKFYCSIASIEDSAKELATSLMVNGAKYLNRF